MSAALALQCLVLIPLSIVLGLRFIVFWAMPLIAHSAIIFLGWQRTKTSWDNTKALICQLQWLFIVCFAVSASGIGAYFGGCPVSPYLFQYTSCVLANIHYLRSVLISAFSPLGYHLKRFWDHRGHSSDHINLDDQIIKSKNISVAQRKESSATATDDVRSINSWTSFELNRIEVMAE